PFAERSFGADPADLARVVDRIDDRLRLVQPGTDGGSAQIVVDGDRDLAREHPLPESPQDPDPALPSRGLGDLERRVVGVRREGESALRRSSGDLGMNLPERVRRRRARMALELCADRVEYRELVIRRG